MIIDIWSDVVCPWCYIGKRRFEKALEGFAHADEVEVRWHSYQLNPDAPADGSMSALEAFCADKGMPVDQATEMFDHVTAVAATEGLTYRFDLARRGNTHDAHRLIHLAQSRGVADAMEERLFQAYFAEGADLNDHEVLAGLAAEVGIPAEDARVVLDSDAYRRDVEADIAQAAAYGITGVPFFVVNGRFGIAGAQGPDDMRKTLDHAWNEQAPLQVATGEGACGPGGCAIH